MEKGGLKCPVYIVDFPSHSLTICCKHCHSPKIWQMQSCLMIWRLRGILWRFGCRRKWWRLRGAFGRVDYCIFHLGFRGSGGHAVHFYCSVGLAFHSNHQIPGLIPTAGLFWLNLHRGRAYLTHLPSHIYYFLTLNRPNQGVFNQFVNYFVVLFFGRFGKHWLFWGLLGRGFTPQSPQKQH